MTTDINTALAEIRERAGQATEGPWLRWTDLDESPEMQGFFMVGDAAVEGEECNPVAHVYIEPDAEFVAAARSDVPRLLAAVDAVLKLHRTGTVKIHGGEIVETCEECGYTPPCPTVEALADALNGENHHG